MTEQRPAGAGLQSHASLRRLIPLALVVGSVLLPLPCRPSARARKVRGPKAAARQAVPNYGVVWENRLTRSGQPRSEEGWRWLRRQGVKSVVNFRAEEDTDMGLGFERVLWLPFTSRTLPTDDHAEEFLAFVRDRRNWPVHMHCKNGRGRTGVMAALVRYAIDGWPLERALAEARTYRRGEDLEPHYVAWLRRWVAHHEPASHRLAPPDDLSDARPDVRARREPLPAPAQRQKHLRADVVGEEHLAREEAVGAGVLAGDFPARGRPRAGRAEGILAVRGVPGGRRHRPAIYHGHGDRIQAGGSSTTEPRRIVQSQTARSTR